MKYITSALNSNLIGYKRCPIKPFSMMFRCCSGIASNKLEHSESSNNNSSNSSNSHNNINNNNNISEQTIASSLTPPQEIYIDPNIYHKEVETILKNNWQYATATHYLRKPASYITGVFVNEPYIVLNSNTSTSSSSSSSSSFSSGTTAAAANTNMNNDNIATNIRAHYNVCRHHASILVPSNTHGNFLGSGSGSGSNTCQIRCPYHGWCYNLKGDLIRAQSIKGIENFQRKNYGLMPIEHCLSLSQQLVFLRFANHHESMKGEKKEEGEDSPYYLGKLDDRLSPVYRWMDQFGFTDSVNSTLRHVKSATYELQCNWKVFVENYLDGGYHVPFAHAGLTNQLSLDSYVIECHDGGVSVQTCRPNMEMKGGGGGEEKEGGSSSSTTKKKSLKSKSDPTAINVDFAERVNRGAVYAFIYPNFMINRYGPWLDVNYVIPTGIRSCQVKFDWFLEESQYTEKGDSIEEFIEKSLKASDQVQKEDMILCDGVQKGIESYAYKRLRGRYAPQIETPLFQFHQLYSKHMGIKL